MLGPLHMRIAAACLLALCGCSTGTNSPSSTGTSVVAARQHCDQVQETLMSYGMLAECEKKFACDEQVRAVDRGQ
jgi:hypothetical protein